jgi:hypothetical protein
MVQPLAHLWNHATDDFYNKVTRSRGQVGAFKRFPFAIRFENLPDSAESSCIVTLEIGNFVFHDAKAYTKQ